MIHHCTIWIDLVGAVTCVAIWLFILIFFFFFVEVVLNFVGLIVLGEVSLKSWVYFIFSADDYLIIVILLNCTMFLQVHFVRLILS